MEHTDNPPVNQTEERPVPAERSQDLGYLVYQMMQPKYERPLSWEYPGYISVTDACGKQWAFGTGFDTFSGNRDDCSEHVDFDVPSADVSRAQEVSDRLIEFLNQQTKG